MLILVVGTVGSPIGLFAYGLNNNGVLWGNEKRCSNANAVLLEELEELSVSARNSITFGHKLRIVLGYLVFVFNRLGNKVVGCRVGENLILIVGFIKNSRLNSDSPFSKIL